MRASWFAAGAAAVWLAVGGVAQACEGSKTVFADQFDRLDLTWGDAGDSFYVNGGHLTVIPSPDQAYYAFNNSGYYDDIDLCVDVLSVNADLSGDSFAGLIFWGVDKDNYYSFVITADGYAAAFRRQKGKSLTQVDWTEFDAIKKGADMANQLRVVTKGNSATLYVNGKEFKQINGQPPEDGWLFGVRAASPKNSKATYGFDNLSLTAVE